MKEVKKFNQNESKKHDEMQIWCYQNIKEILIKASTQERIADDFEIIRVEIEKPILKTTHGNINIVGYLDLYCEFIFNEIHQSVLIEIKPEIYSLGDLIRQVKTYKTHSRDKGVFIVVSKTDKYKDILNEQGIRFFKYEN